MHPSIGTQPAGSCPGAHSCDLQRRVFVVSPPPSLISVQPEWFLSCLCACESTAVKALLQTGQREPAALTRTSVRWEDFLSYWVLLKERVTVLLVYFYCHAYSHFLMQGCAEDRILILKWESFEYIKPALCPEKGNECLSCFPSCSRASQQEWKMNIKMGSENPRRGLCSQPGHIPPMCLPQSRFEDSVVQGERTFELKALGLKFSRVIATWD